MIKALLKKQLLESVSFLFVDAKKQKKRAWSAGFWLAFMLFAALLSVFSLFWHTGDMLCKPLVGSGLTWVYFAMMGLIAVTFSVIGGIFTTKAKLYEAKDNDFLLSMPISPKAILFVRMVSLYLFSLFFSSVVFLPAIVRYATFAKPSAFVILGQIAVNFILPFGSLAISCLLGWLIAWVTSKIPSKNLVSVFFSIVFLVAYFVLYSKTNSYLQYVMEHGDRLGENIKSYFYPFYQLAWACLAKWSSFFLFALIFVGVFAAIYLLISCTYLRLIIVNKGARKVQYKERTHKQKSLFSTLLKKELKRYFGNPMVALNCFMGVLLAVAFPIFAACNMKLVRALSKPEWEGGIALVLGVIYGFIVGSNIVSGISVSLEGENIWILQTSPVPAKKVLLVKAVFHWIWTAPIALVSGLVLCVLFKLGVLFILLLLLSILVFSVFFALLGLFINLKMPRLHWTSEMACVKQSFSAILSLFSGWLTCGVLVGGYFWFGKYLPTWGYFLVGIGLLLILTAALCVWLVKRGTKIFEKLA